MTLRHREVIPAAVPVESPEDADTDNLFMDDGEYYEEVDVYNFVNVQVPCNVRGGNPTVEKFSGEAQIGRANESETPEYITEWVARELWHELGLDRLDETHGIEVVDLEDDEVLIL